MLATSGGAKETEDDVGKSDQAGRLVRLAFRLGFTHWAELHDTK